MANTFNPERASADKRHRQIKMITPYPLDYWGGLWESKEQFLQESQGMRYLGMSALIKEPAQVVSNELSSQTYIVRPWSFLNGLTDNDLELFPKDGITPQFRIVSDDYLSGGKYVRRERFIVDYPGSRRESEVLADFASYRNPSEQELNFRIGEIANNILPNIAAALMSNLDNKIDNVNNSLTAKINSEVSLINERYGRRIDLIEKEIEKLKGIEPTGDVLEDWFLPSEGEWNKIYLNLLSGMDENSVAFDPNDINGRDLLSEFSAITYWTSTQVNANESVFFDVSTGMVDQIDKSKFIAMRPVRRFISQDPILIRETGRSFNSLVFYSSDNGNGTFTIYEIAHRDLRQAAVWQPSNDLIDGLSDVLGRGSRNTENIVSFINDWNQTNNNDFTDSAAQLCDRIIMDKNGNIEFKRDETPISPFAQ